MSNAMASPTQMFENGYKRTFNYVRHAIERRTNKERFIVSDKTSHQVVYREGLMQLRYYPHADTQSFQLDDQVVTPTKERHKVPVVLVPPLGVFGWIYDLMAERSWVRFLNAQGFEVYLVDWGSPQKEDADLGLETYVGEWLNHSIDQVLQHSGSNQVSLVGYCMGGLLSLLYTGAYGQEKVRNVVTIASPIDFHASHFYGAFLDKASKTIKKLPLEKLNLKNDFFHVPGDMLSFAFKMTNPFAGVVSYFDLIRNLADRDYVKAHLTTREWFSNMPDYPGATVQQLFIDFGLNNSFAKGKVNIGSMESDIAGISANLLAFAGKSDKIVSINAAEKIMDVVGSEDKTFRVVPGGHAGVFAGGKAKEHTWALTAEWLAKRAD